MDTKDEKSEHARALGELGAAKGGKARAKALTADERKEIARYAALVRWKDRTGLPRATHGDPDRPLRIGELELPCYVLAGGRRVLAQSGMISSLGMARGGSRGTGGDRLAKFVLGKSISAFVSRELAAVTSNPMRFITPRGAIALGYEATILADICEVVLKARDAGLIQKQQEPIARRCEILMRAFAKVGIIALVDEATGYQADRAKDELIKILEAYISKELLPWTKRFPPEFFEEIYRLQGWQFREGHLRGPRFVGKLINQFVYEKLPPGVLPELQRKNPTTDSGYRRHKHHQFLTQDIGHPHLDKQVTAVMTLMRASEDKAMFKRLFDRAFPQKGKQLALNLAGNEE